MKPQHSIPEQMSTGPRAALQLSNHAVFGMYAGSIAYLPLVCAVSSARINTPQFERRHEPGGGFDVRNHSSGDGTRLHPAARRSLAGVDVQGARQERLRSDAGLFGPDHLLLRSAVGGDAGRGAGVAIAHAGFGAPVRSGAV